MAGRAYSARSVSRNFVVGHVIAIGGIAMTVDLLGQFVGQDVLRRLSRRLGEGAFNGALTARLQVVAVEITRPLPYLDTEPLHARVFGERVFAPDFETCKVRRRLTASLIIIMRQQCPGAGSTHRAWRSGASSRGPDVRHQ